MLGGLVEVLGHVHVAKGGGEAAAGCAGADPPSRRLLLGSSHILPEMMENKFNGPGGLDSASGDLGEHLLSWEFV